MKQRINRMNQVNRNTICFVALLMLSGLLYTLNRTPIPIINSILFCSNFAIQTGLLLFWIQSVRNRLLPTTSRAWIIAAAYLMLAVLLMRVFKYRITIDLIATRYVSYAYYLPLMLMPALFLMTCISIRFGTYANETSGRSRRFPAETLIMIPALVLSLTVMTNDIHHLVYIPLSEIGFFDVASGTYTYGPVFYLLYAFMILCIATGLVLLIRERSISSRKRNYMLYMVLMLWSAMLLLFNFVLDPLNMVRPFSMPEIQVFGILGLFESCINGRLIPYNENYTGLFRESSIPAVITDRSLAPVYQTTNTISATKAQMTGSLKAPVYIDENNDIRMTGKPLTSGYVFWTTDETELHRLNEELMDANETLDAENTLIEAENLQMEEKAKMDFYSRTYRDISDELYPKHREIADILAGMQPETDRFRLDVERICILNVFIKRATNLLLMSAEHDVLPSRELLLALEESAKYLTLSGIQTEVTGDPDTTIGSGVAYQLYKTFEDVIESLCPDIRLMTVTLRNREIRIAADTALQTVKVNTSLAVNSFRDDDLLYISISASDSGERTDTPSKADDSRRTDKSEETDSAKETVEACSDEKINSTGGPV